MKHKKTNSDKKERLTLSLRRSDIRTLKNAAAERTMSRNTYLQELFECVAAELRRREPLIVAAS